MQLIQDKLKEKLQVSFNNFILTSSVFQTTSKRKSEPRREFQTPFATLSGQDLSNILFNGHKAHVHGSTTKATLQRRISRDLINHVYFKVTPDNEDVPRQQHTEQPEFINEGEVDQNAEQCHDTCPLPAKLTDDKTTEFSNQSLEYENICLKKTVA
ncbi:hypothetical protein Tco_0313115 [Tanacetum coccineum]